MRHTAHRSFLLGAIMAAALSMAPQASVLAAPTGASGAGERTIVCNVGSQRMSYAAFKALSPARQRQVFAQMSGQEIYDLVAGSDESWPVTAYDLITPENAKDTIVLDGDDDSLHFNLAWPLFGGMAPETIGSIANLSGTLDVSRSGGDGGHSMSLGKDEDGSYPSNSERGVPSSSATVRTGTFDVDRYKEVAEVVTNGEDVQERKEALMDMGYDEETAMRLIDDQAAWLLRDEVSGPDNIQDGAMLAGHDVDGRMGYYGEAAPWVTTGLDLVGGAGQLNTIFSWGTLVASGIVYDIGTATIS